MKDCKIVAILCGLMFSVSVFSQELNEAIKSSYIPKLPNTEFAGKLADSEKYDIRERLKLVDERFNLKRSLGEDLVEASYVAAMEKEALGEKFQNTPLPKPSGKCHYAKNGKPYGCVVQNRVLPENNPLQKKVENLEKIIEEQNKKLSTIKENPSEIKKEKIF